MKKLHPTDTLAWLRDQTVFMDDFFWLISPHFWTSDVTDAGSACAMDADGDGGIVTMSTGAVDNNEVYLRSTNQAWTFGAGESIYVEARVQYSEAATSACNFAFGLSSELDADDFLQDDGAGPDANHTGAVIFKVDGGTVWKAHTSNSTTQTTSTSVKTAGGSSYQRLALKLEDVDGTNMDVTFFVDDQPLLDSSFRRPIKHQVAIASAAAMNLGFYLKAGSGSEETVNLDYVYVSKRR